MTSMLLGENGKKYQKKFDHQDLANKIGKKIIMKLRPAGIGERKNCKEKWQKIIRKLMTSKQNGRQFCNPSSDCRIDSDGNVNFSF